MCGCKHKKKKQSRKPKKKCKYKVRKTPNGHMAVVCTTPKCFNLFRAKKKTLWPRKRRRKLAGLSEVNIKSKKGKVQAREKNAALFDFLK